MAIRAGAQACGNCLSTRRRSASVGSSCRPACLDAGEHAPPAPGGAPEQPPAPRSRAGKWAANLAAARQFHAREGHLQPAGKRIEVVNGIEHKLGMFLDNTRRCPDKLSEERRKELTELGMRWAGEGGVTSTQHDAYGEELACFGRCQGEQ